MDTEYTTPHEEIAGSWPEARAIIARHLPHGQPTWEGSKDSLFAQLTTAPHMVPFSIVIVGQDHLLAYQRSVGGRLGLPLVIVRIQRATPHATRRAA